MKSSTNARFLMNIMMNLDPPLRIKPEIAQYLAKNYNTWRVSQYYIEKEFLNVDGERDSAVFALNTIFKGLGEKDYLYGLKQILTSDEKIKQALI